MIPLAALFITDGTTHVDLMSASASFRLASWNSTMPSYKGGGVFADSPLSDGRRLVDRHFNNIVDTFQVNEFAGSQDNLIYLLQDLWRLFEKATEYWTTEWQSTPVYVATKSRFETNIRYALISQAVLPNGPSPFESPFDACNEVIANGLSLIIEHSFWQDTAPGVLTALPISAFEPWNGINLGNVDSAGARQTVTGAEQMYIAPRHNQANLTHIFRERGGAVFEAGNEMTNALPWQIYAQTSPPVATYFGSSTAITGAGPFSSIVFDIGIAAGAFVTGVWQYWSGAAWTAFPAGTLIDNTLLLAGVPFSRTGVHSVHWTPPVNWAANAVNGVTAWWVRVFLSSYNDTRPTQQNRDPYAVIWSYIEVQAADVGGDLSALLNLRLTNTSQPASGDTSERKTADHVFVGLRSKSRDDVSGGEFVAYLNLSGVQNPYWVTSGTGANTGTDPDTDSPSGRRANYSPLGSEAMAMRAYLSIGFPRVFSGRFRVFIRLKQVGGTVGQMAVRLRLSYGTLGIASDVLTPTITVPAISYMLLLDLGLLNIAPLDLIASDQYSNPLIISVEASSTSTTPDLYMYDLVFIPQDEWAAEFIDTARSLETTIGYTDYLEIDSIVNRRRMIRSLLKAANNGILGIYEPRSVSPAIIQANSRQRIWTLVGNEFNDLGVAATGFLYASPHIGFAVQAYRTQRYAGLRGAR